MRSYSIKSIHWQKSTFLGSCLWSLNANYEKMDWALTYSSKSWSFMHCKRGQKVLIIPNNWNRIQRDR